MERREPPPGPRSERHRHLGHHDYAFGGSFGSGLIDTRRVLCENNRDCYYNDEDYGEDDGSRSRSRSRGYSLGGYGGQPLPREIFEGHGHGYSGGAGSRSMRGGGGIQGSRSSQHSRGGRSDVLPYDHDCDDVEDDGSYSSSYSYSSHYSSIPRHSHSTQGAGRNDLLRGVVDDRYLEELDFHSRDDANGSYRAGFTLSYDRGCGLDPLGIGRTRAGEGGFGGEATQEPEEIVEEGSTVDHVHHSSPIGPATSVYPKGYLAATQKKKPPPSVSLLSSSVPPSSPRVTPGRRGFENAEAAKIAAHQQSRMRGGSSATSTPMIEIHPGVFVRLRGAAETKECIRRDFFMPTICLSCSLEQFCIQDASYVLCPQCRVVSPVSFEENGIDFGAVSSTCRGVGLGFTLQDLESIQLELMEERRQAHHHAARQQTATTAYSCRY